MFNVIIENWSRNCWTVAEANSYRVQYTGTPEICSFGFVGLLFFFTLEGWIRLLAVYNYIRNCEEKFTFSIPRNPIQMISFLCTSFPFQMDTVTHCDCRLEVAKKSYFAVGQKIPLNKLIDSFQIIFQTLADYCKSMNPEQIGSTQVAFQVCWKSYTSERGHQKGDWWQWPSSTLCVGNDWCWFLCDSQKNQQQQ